MAEFSIHPSAVRQSAGSLGTISEKLRSIQSRIHTVQSSITNTSSIVAVKKSIEEVETSMGTYSGRVRQMQSVLNSSVTKYERAETVSSGKSVSAWQSWVQDHFDRNIPGWKLFDSETSRSGNSREWNGAVARYKGDGVSEESWLKAMASSTASWAFPGMKKSSDVHRGDGKYDKKYKDTHWVEEKGGQYSLSELTEYAEDKGSVLEAGLDWKLEGSLYQKKVGNENVNGSITVGKAETHASVKGGIYAYDKNGKEVFAPAVEAVVGGSVTALALEGHLKAGNDLFGAGADAELTLGKASADATAKIALFGKDKNGKLNPEVQASASAEAIAVEVKGSGHITVAGVEGTVSGSVNIGVGAHADIGIVDGKVKCDIGAAFGIGASISFEIDTKPLINATCSKVKEVWTSLRIF